MACALSGRRRRRRRRPILLLESVTVRGRISLSLSRHVASGGTWDGRHRQRGPPPPPFSRLTAHVWTGGGGRGSYMSTKSISPRLADYFWLPPPPLNSTLFKVNGFLGLFGRFFGGRVGGEGNVEVQRRRETLLRSWHHLGIDVDVNHWNWFFFFFKILAVVAVTFEASALSLSLSTCIRVRKCLNLCRQLLLPA